RVLYRGAGHGEYAGGVFEIIGKAVMGKFAADAVAGISHAGALRIPALDHKSGDHAVEDHAVIKSLLDQGDKIVDCIRGDLRIKLRPDHLAVFHFNGYNWILCHNTCSFSSDLQISL